MIFYYFAGTDRIYSAFEIKRMTGLDPEEVGQEALAAVGVYNIDDLGNDVDTDFYSVTKSYTVDYATLTATAVYTGTDLPLAEAQANGIKRVKENAAQAANIQDDFGALLLVASAAKLGYARETQAQTELEEIAGYLLQCIDNIIDINAAADSAAIEAVVNDPNKVTRALTAEETAQLRGEDPSFAGDFSLSGGLTDAADDTAAAAAGVAVNQFYRNGSVVQIRVS